MRCYCGLSTRVIGKTGTTSGSSAHLSVSSCSSGIFEEMERSDVHARVLHDPEENDDSLVEGF